MRRLSPAGHRSIATLAGRHGFSEEAVMNMVESIMQGNGCTAQFSHPEFGGCGQWTRGGPTTLADMFDRDLKTRVDTLCGELSNLVTRQPELLRRGDACTPPQPQQQAAISGAPGLAGASAASPQQHGGQALHAAGGRASATMTPAAPATDAVFAKIERLAALRARGLVSEEEFAAKKAELLARL